MGKVELGAGEEDGRWRPCVRIEFVMVTSAGERKVEEVVYWANITFDNDQDAKQMATSTYLILSGKQINAQHHKEGIIQ